jgi:hypothetical protein
MTSIINPDIINTSTINADTANLTNINSRFINSNTLSTTKILLDNLVIAENTISSNNLTDIVFSADPVGNVKIGSGTNLDVNNNSIINCGRLHISSTNGVIASAGDLLLIPENNLQIFKPTLLNSNKLTGKNISLPWQTLKLSESMTQPGIIQFIVDSSSDDYDRFINVSSGMLNFLFGYTGVYMVSLSATFVLSNVINGDLDGSCNVFFLDNNVIIHSAPCQVINSVNNDKNAHVTLSFIHNFTLAESDSYNFTFSVSAGSEFILSSSNVTFLKVG